LDRALLSVGPIVNAGRFTARLKQAAEKHLGALDFGWRSGSPKRCDNRQIFNTGFSRRNQATREEALFRSL
jgi:hypothetical protein